VVADTGSNGDVQRAWGPSSRGAGGTARPRAARMAPGRRLSFLACFEILNRRISASFKSHLDPLHDEIMDFTAFPESGFPQGFIDRFREIKTGMDHIWPCVAPGGPPGRTGGGWGYSNALGQVLRSYGLPSPLARYFKDDRAVRR
jgi:hypothetical protein